MATDQCRGKRTWPELLGAPGRVAAATIERENRFVDAVIVLDSPETVVTGDFLCTRVRVWVNANGIVTRVPAIA